MSRLTRISYEVRLVDLNRNLARWLEIALFGALLVSGNRDVFADEVNHLRPASQPVVSFNWVYLYEPSPGIRAWSLDTSNRWHERYPDGSDSIFDIVERGSVAGCSGSIATHSNEPHFHVFVPDTQCPAMVALFTRDNRKWNNMGVMRDIQSVPFVTLDPPNPDPG